jgi:DNA-directed RNA polymerase beta subunit
MDNFNLKAYLANNPLLMEEVEEINEDLLPEGISQDQIDKTAADILSKAGLKVDAEDVANNEEEAEELKSQKKELNEIGVLTVMGLIPLILQGAGWIINGIKKMTLSAEEKKELEQTKDVLKAFKKTSGAKKYWENLRNKYLKKHNVDIFDDGFWHGGKQSKTTSIANKLTEADSDAYETLRNDPEWQEDLKDVQNKEWEYEGETYKFPKPLSVMQHDEQGKFGSKAGNALKSLSHKIHKAYVVPIMALLKGLAYSSYALTGKKNQLMKKGQREKFANIIYAIVMLKAAGDGVFSHMSHVHDMAGIAKLGLGGAVEVGVEAFKGGASIADALEAAVGATELASA